MWKSFPWLVVLPFLILFGGVRLSHADALTEQQIKVAYLYHFTKFVTWPSTVFTNDQDAFRLCVLGENPFEQLLDLLTKKTIHNRPISVQYFKNSQPFTSCHLLFIAQSEQNNLPSILSELQNKPVLTISDLPDFIQQGGIIQFIHHNDTLRFAINQKPALSIGLKISATMLQVSHVIQ